MSEFNMTRDSDRCLICLECIQVCPQSQPGISYPVIVEAADGHSPPEIAHIENCIQCLLCFNSCRSSAIRLENYHLVEPVVVNQRLLQEAFKII